MSGWIKYSLWYFHDLWCSRQSLMGLCDCKLHFVATAWLSNVGFFSERQLMRSSLALLQSKVWHYTPCYQVWDEPEIIFRDTVHIMWKAVMQHKLSCFRHSEIIISLTTDSSEALIKRLSGLFLLCYKSICHILTMLSHIIPFQKRVSYNAEALCDFWY